MPVPLRFRRPLRWVIHPGALAAATLLALSPSDVAGQDSVPPLPDVPDQPTAGQPLPGQVVPDQPTSGAPVPGQTVPGQPAGGLPLPGQPLPGQTVTPGPLGGQAQPVPAQQTRRGENCEPVSFRVLTHLDLGGSRMTQMGLPDIVCDDGVRISADSAIQYEATGRVEFIGGFRYEDADRVLTAIDADYFEPEGRLFARGNTEMISRDGGTEIRGETLDLVEGLEGPADDELVVIGNPAFALFRPETSANGEAEEEDAPESAASSGDQPSAPYELNGRNLRFEGEEFVHANGDAVLVRDSLRGTGAQLTFARESGVLTITGNARLISDGSEFRGEVIELLLPNDELTAIQIRGQSELLSEDLTLTAAEIRIDMEDGEMRHLVAIRRLDAPPAQPQTPGQPFDPAAPVATGPGGEPARAEADAFVLVGDSIDVISEGGVIQTAWAVGSARAVARDPEDAGTREPSATGIAPADASDSSTDAPDPTGAPDPSTGDPAVAIVPPPSAAGPTDDETGPESPAGETDRLTALLSEDWIEGDTIEVIFAPAPEPRGEGDPDYVLDGLVAIGNARSLYRSPPEEANSGGEPRPQPPREEWGISYMLADRIALALVAGAVESVESSGNVIGEFLEPDVARSVPSDSTRTPGAR